MPLFNIESKRTQKTNRKSLCALRASVPSVFHLFTTFAILLTLTLTLTLTLSITTPSNAATMHAVWYFMNSETPESALESDFAAIAAAGFNTILIPAVVTQETVTSNEVQAPSQEYVAALAASTPPANTGSTSGSRVFCWSKTARGAAAFSPL